MTTDFPMVYRPNLHVPGRTSDLRPLRASCRIETRPHSIRPTDRNRSRCPKSRSSDQMRAEVLLAKSIGVQAPPVDFHAQQLFQPDIAEPHLRPKVVEECELAGLGRRLEHHRLETELAGKPVRQHAAEISALVEQP